LGAQRQAAILVGAHAVSLRVGEGDVGTTPHTTDADLAPNPFRLLRGGDFNPIANVLREARSARLPASDPAVAAAIATTVALGLQYLDAEFSRDTARG
jgi:hypothetical protein